MMSPRSLSSASSGAFESILAALDDAANQPLFRPVAGLERLWASMEISDAFGGASIAHCYAEYQGDQAPDAPRCAPPTYEQVMARITCATSAEQLRRLRRSLALAAHPDRVAPEDRAEAELLMAKVNAAIDLALTKVS